MSEAEGYPARPRTLAEHLRGLDPAALAEVLESRPDLLRPAPRDIADLVARATGPASIARALEGLDAWRSVVAEALAALPDPCATTELTVLLGAAPDEVAAALATLRGLALVWGPDDALHLVRGVRESFQPYPGGLAPPSPRPLDDAQIDAALAACGEVVRPVLDRLLWAPTGALPRADRRVDPATARSAVDLLLGHGLLRPLDPDTVILPREVSWRLRGYRFTREPVPATAPPVTGRARSASLADRAGVGAATEILHAVEHLADALERTPHRLLRDGGLASRDVTALARDLGGDPAYAAFLVECAVAAGLAGADGGTLLPTADYDRWAAASLPERWARLATAWRAADRVFVRSAEPGAHPLGPQATVPGAARVRGTVLRLARDAGPGLVIDLESLTAAAAWADPRLAAVAGALVTATWREASWLGVVALGMVGSLAGPVIDGSALPPAVRDLFPEPVHEIVLQGDLTAVAPGLLTHPVAAELRLLADQESRGGGGVYRFSAGSLRRAFDAGWSAAEVLEWLGRHASTEPPQALLYLVEDVARRHGSIRVGPAGSWARIEDPAQLAALLAHPESRSLGVRQVAPGVVVASTDEAELVALLRDLGHAPAVEDATGTVRTAPVAPRSRRSKAETAEPVSAAEVAAGLLARAMPARDPSQAIDVDQAIEASLAELRAATRDAQPVQVTYVTTAGRRAERALSPLDLTDGAVRGVDRDSAEVVTIPLARISKVRPVRSRP